VHLDGASGCSTVLPSGLDLSAQPARSGDDVFDYLASLRDLRLRLQGLLAKLVGPRFGFGSAEKLEPRFGPLARQCIGFARVRLVTGGAHSSSAPEGVLRSVDGVSDYPVILRLAAQLGERCLRCGAIALSGQRDHADRQQACEGCA
jgi:hypothetical protein